jgi:hypothetical protein
MDCLEREVIRNFGHIGGRWTIVRTMMEGAERHFGGENIQSNI